MSISASLLALASLAALATAALAPTSAFADGSVRLRYFAAHSHFGFFCNRYSTRYDPYKSWSCRIYRE
jgi:hypothetical protein